MIWKQVFALGDLRDQGDQNQRARSTNTCIVAQAKTGTFVLLTAEALGEILTLRNVFCNPYGTIGAVPSRKEE